MIKNADIEDRIPEYRKARDAFSKQLEVVSSLQSQLKVTAIFLLKHISYVLLLSKYELKIFL